MAQRDDELDDLRRRAYGPDSDIHEDAPALERLRALEGRAGRAPVVDEPAEPEPEPEPDEALARTRRARMLDVAALVPPRAWLAAAVTVVALAVCATALVVVQRVQADPLGAGADQVERLSVDPFYELPKFFTSFGDGGYRAVVYEEFHGMRVVVVEGGVFGGSLDDRCVGVYRESDILDRQSSSFQGRLVFGCEAGGFPAVVQFRTSMQGVAGGLATAFPGETAVQFVYDSANDEVVVFAIPVEE